MAWSLHVAALGANIDWSGCPTVADRAGEAVIRGTPMRPIDLIADRDLGEDGLARSYGLPLDTVRSVLSFYHGHKRQLAAAV